MSALTAMVRKAVIALMVLAIDAYRLLLSPWVGRGCRFEPSCSQYAKTAIQRHGPIRGLGLTIHRLGRCHPGCPGGYDPVPEN